MNFNKPLPIISSSEFLPALESTWSSHFLRIRFSNVAPRVLHIGGVDEAGNAPIAAFLMNELCGKHGELFAIEDLSAALGSGLDTDIGLALVVSNYTYAYDIHDSDSGPTCSQGAGDSTRYATLYRNLDAARGYFRIIDKPHLQGLKTLLEELEEEGLGFDWIYIQSEDSSRSSAASSKDYNDTFQVCELAWSVTRQDSIFVIEEAQHNGRTSLSIVNTFLHAHMAEYERLESASTGQVMLLKSSSMQSPRTTTSNTDALQQNLHLSADYTRDDVMGIILTARSESVKSTIAVLKDIISFNSGAINVAIVNYDLTPSDQNLLINSIPPTRKNLILRFEFLTLDNLLTDVRKDITWALIDAIDLSFSNRTLYINDNIICLDKYRDLRTIWNTDLQDMSIGAIESDSISPEFESRTHASRFKLDLMLIDLTRVRSQLPALRQLAWKMGNLGYSIEDVFNVHFFSDWTNFAV